MSIVTTTVYDGPDRTDFKDVDDVARCTTLRTVWKAGSSGFNQQALATRVTNAIADCDTAEALIQANGWDGLTAAQRKAISLGIVQDIRAAARILLGRTDSAS